MAVCELIEANSMVMVQHRETVLFTILNKHAKDRVSVTLPTAENGDGCLTPQQEFVSNST